MLRVCVNHPMAQMLATVANDRQDQWNGHLHHVEFASNTFVRAATELAANDFHVGFLPRFHSTVSNTLRPVGTKASTETPWSTATSLLTVRADHVGWSANKMS